ncbi:MAG: DUF1049 domain-containing protein [Nitrospinaceae bacterium]|nr:LapA family protein [Nitrospinaceae bacterium]NIR54938.1 LapA family protein [Nitrospinaceae bacterium]NIT82180.1 LapA family protein [Nitrospinaceae bacterium]NIX34567.1 DUF1049 domain-containing protein [Nitrospinaceae bacterium]NIY15393.1 DUF1049 domain-containing protein [Nitrospinaceae bacterium]
MTFKFILFIILAIFIAIFAVKNMGMVEISFYDFSINPFTIRMPLLVVILISLALGFLVAWLDGWVSRLKLKSTIRRQEKTIESLNDQISKTEQKALPKIGDSGR